MSKHPAKKFKFVYCTKQVYLLKEQIVLSSSCALHKSFIVQLCTIGPKVAAHVFFIPPAIFLSVGEQDKKQKILESRLFIRSF